MDRIENLLKRLRSNQSNSDNPRSFEQDIADALSLLGFKAEAKGGPNDCDVLLFHRDDVAVVDAKTTKAEVIGETNVNFDALDRYKETYKADTVAIVAKGFSEGNIRKTAEKKKVVLIETEGLCKALENQVVYPYNPTNLYVNLFQGRAVVTNNDIEPSTKPVDRQISILRRFFEAMETSKSSKVTVKDLHTHFRLSGLDFSEEEIRVALDFLCTPPLNIAGTQEDTYHLLLPLEEMRSKLGIIFSAVGQAPSPPVFQTVPPIGGQTKVTAGEFQHEGGGIYAWEKNRQIRIDVTRPSEDVVDTLSKAGLSVVNPGSFYYALRRNAGLLKKRKH